MSKKVCEISILGNKYTIKSDEPEKKIREIESYVNQKIEEVLKKSKSISTQNATVMAALNIAGEYFKVKESQRDYHAGVVKKSKDILDWIDARLKNVENVKTWV